MKDNIRDKQLDVEILQVIITTISHYDGTEDVNYIFRLNAIPSEL